jgi:hypothetical protein
MTRYWAYLKKLLLHKWYVYLEGRKLGLPVLRLLIHDWDKFGYKMFTSYARTFYSVDGEGQYIPDPWFDYTWNRHQKISRHHWQAWLLVRDTGEVVPLQMPVVDATEMIADWRGAGRAYSKPDQKWKPSETAEWYWKNREKMILHPLTRELVEAILDVRYHIPNDSSDTAPQDSLDH